MMEAAARLEVAEFLYQAAYMLDEFRLEEFADQFTDDGRYVLIPRENHVRNLPVCVIDDDKNRLMYRNDLIRKHWQYEPFRENRILGNVLVHRVDATVVQAKSNFSVIHTSYEGASKLQLAGVFTDDLVREGKVWKIKRRYAILDTFLPDEAIVVPP
jgi:3-phenylpropionate/cinnamic acid dioxygenase small subunit